MTTARLLLIIAVFLAIFTAIAQLWKPADIAGGRTPLIWVSDNNPARTDQIAYFNKEHPELDLRLDYGNSGLQKIILQCSSGVGPDIFDYGDDQLQALVETGILQDVTEAAQKMGFSAQKDAWPTGSALMTYDGKQYGYPCNTGTAILIYNKNVFDHFGIPYPKGLMTMDEFLELAQKVNDPRAARQIYAVAGLNWRALFDCARGEFFTPDGLPNLTSPELTKALQFHKDLIFKYHMMPSTLEAKSMSGQGGWGSGNLNQFASARFAMLVTGEWSLVAFHQAYRHQLEVLKAQGIKEEDIKNPLDRPLRIGAVLIPNFPGMPPSYRMTSRLAGVNQRSPRKEQALAFLQYLAGPTYSKLLNESADFLPGNPKYADLGIEPGYPALSRVELHETTKQAISYGYNQRRSPFLLTSDVARVMDDQIGRMETDPSIPVEELLSTAQERAMVLMRRNIDRNPQLKELYEQRFGSAKK